MSLLDFFGRRAKAQPIPAPEETSKADELEIYSGMRVEVTTPEGQLLFVAKLLGLNGDRAELLFHPGLRTFGRLRN